MGFCCWIFHGLWESPCIKVIPPTTTTTTTTTRVTSRPAGLRPQVKKGVAISATSYTYSRGCRPSVPLAPPWDTGSVSGWSTTAGMTAQSKKKYHPFILLKTAHFSQRRSRQITARSVLFFLLWGGGAIFDYTSAVFIGVFKSCQIF